MPLADYAHWNEEAEQVWWQEEGRHAEEPPEVADDDYRLDAEDAFGEEVADWDVEMIRSHLADADYCRRWPKAVAILRGELEYRGED